MKMLEGIEINSKIPGGGMILISTFLGSLKLFFMCKKKKTENDPNNNVQESKFN